MNERCWPPSIGIIWPVTDDSERRYKIPFNNSSGGLVYYRAPEGELQTSNYFYPMKLSSLSIKLFDDNGNEYDSNNGDNYFEFEITIVENTELFK